VPTPVNFGLPEPGDDFALAFQSATARGCFGGGQIGFNYQFPSNVVVGVEADYSVGGIKASFSAFEDVDATYLFETKLKSLATVRARLGMAFGQWLPYITGGWAWGRNTLSLNAADDDGAFSSSVSKVHSGAAFGAGLEFAIDRNWSVKAEYLHLRLRTKRYEILLDAGTDPVIGADFGPLKVDTFRLGLNYRFDWATPVVARY
jgi:outer membrane immunogenic protein